MRAVDRQLRKKRRLGAVALEYILISALVAIGLLGAFAYWGRTLNLLFEHVAWDSSAALEELVK